MSLFSVIQHTSTTNVSSLAFGSNVTVGSMIVVVIGIWNGAGYTSVLVNSNAANLVASYIDAADHDYIQIWVVGPFEIFHSAFASEGSDGDDGDHWPLRKRFRRGIMAVWISANFNMPVGGAWSCL
jgi:hypothetical protein